MIAALHPLQSEMDTERAIVSRTGLKEIRESKGAGEVNLLLGLLIPLNREGSQLLQFHS